MANICIMFFLCLSKNSVLTLIQLQISADNKVLLSIFDVYCSPLASISPTAQTCNYICIRVLPFKSDRHNEVSFTSQCHLNYISFLFWDLSPSQSSKMPFVLLFDFRVFLCFYLKQTFFRKFKIVLKLQMFFKKKFKQQVFTKFKQRDGHFFTE